MRAALLGVGLLVAFATLALARAPARAEPRWEELTRLSTPRAHLQAQVLETGDVLVVGGVDAESSGIAVDSTELLDPRTGGTRLVPHRDAPIDPKLVALPNGLVVATGGSRRTGEGWVQVATTELFDPWTAHWLATAPMTRARADHGAAVLRDGRLLVAGGHLGTRMLDSVEVFDPIRERWRAVAPLPRPRMLFATGTRPDGRVIVAGGLEHPGLPSRTSLVYDPLRDTWDEGPDLLVERVLHTTVALPGGDLLLIGGQRGAAGTVERYDAKAQRFVHAGTLALPRMLSHAAVLEDGRVLVVGGLPRPGRTGRLEVTASAEIFDAATRAWTTVATPGAASAFGGLVSTAHGVVLIAGAGENEQALDRVFRYQ